MPSTGDMMSANMHGRVDAVAAHGLQRDLGAQLRRAGDVEEAVPLADRAVLRQRAAGLPHEPHRRALDRLAQRGPNEERPSHLPRLAPPWNATGPLVARWRTLERAPVEAGALQHATVEVENAGSATWRTRGAEEGLFLAYHWLDERGNPIVWDGLRTPLERAVAPGETLRQTLRLRAPIPPGRYRLAVDLVEEHRFWLAEIGNAPYEEDVDVLPRDATRSARVPRETARSPRTTGPNACALCTTRATPRSAARSRSSAAACAAAIRLSRRTRPAAAGILASRTRSSAPRCCRRSSRTARSPACPPIAPDGDEPWMFDGRLVVRLRSRSDRRRG